MTGTKKKVQISEENGIVPPQFGFQLAIEIFYPCKPQPVRNPLPVKIIYSTNVQGLFVIVTLPST